MASPLKDQNREILRQVASDSVLHGLENGQALPVSLESYPGPLREGGAAFVTLKHGGRLRGCVGSYLPRRPLVEDVAENAFSAAFRDPRFPPLTRDEADGLEFHISLLSPMVLVEAESREELLRIMRPGVDGILLEDPPHRSTFLPQVWDQLPDPPTFLDELFLKAGLSRGHWSQTLQIHRYTVEGF
jgi:AmmeMemoRadiSam system protein A